MSSNLAKFLQISLCLAANSHSGGRHRFSIHCQDKQSDELRAAVGSFPKLVQGSSHAYHCGYASKGSFGAVSYLLVREGGNVLVDSPRFDSKLLKNIEVRC